MNSSTGIQQGGHAAGRHQGVNVRAIFRRVSQQIDHLRGDFARRSSRDHRIARLDGAGKRCGRGQRHVDPGGTRHFSCDAEYQNGGSEGCGCRSQSGRQFLGSRGLEKAPRRLVQLVGQVAPGPFACFCEQCLGLRGQLRKAIFQNLTERCRRSGHSCFYSNRQCCWGRHRRQDRRPYQGTGHHAGGKI